MEEGLFPMNFSVTVHFRKREKLCKKVKYSLVQCMPT